MVRATMQLDLKIWNGKILLDPYMNEITLQQEDQVVERIVNKLNNLVDKQDQFVEAGRAVWEELDDLKYKDYGTQARIIRKVANHPKLKYNPQRVKQAWITISKFPKLLGQAHDLLDSSKYEVLATSRLKAPEMEKFEIEAKEKRWSYRELKQAIHAHKAETSDNYPVWLQYGNCWKFSGCDPRMGLEGHPGRIPGQITLNLLHYYTEENDLFVSAFGGSGTDIDACKLMKRKCVAFDLNPVREDIKKADLTTGIPLDSEIADFVFFDPPWLSAQKDKYSGEQRDLANMQFEDFYIVMDK